MASGYIRDLLACSTEPQPTTTPCATVLSPLMRAAFYCNLLLIDLIIPIKGRETVATKLLIVQFSLPAVAYR